MRTVRNAHGPHVGQAPATLSLVYLSFPNSLLGGFGLCPPLLSPPKLPPSKWPLPPAGPRASYESLDQESCLECITYTYDVICTQHALQASWLDTGKLHCNGRDYFTERSGTELGSKIRSGTIIYIEYGIYYRPQCIIGH